MKTRIMESPARRIPVAVAALLLVVLAGAAVYYFQGGGESRQADAQKILIAAQTYTRALRERHLPVPRSVTLQTLLDQGFLQPADAGPFRGMEANISLIATNGRPLALMQVRLPDGSNLVLLPNGRTQQVK